MYTTTKAARKLDTSEHTVRKLADSLGLGIRVGRFRALTEKEVDRIGKVLEQRRTKQPAA